MERARRQVGAPLPLLGRHRRRRPAALRRDGRQEDQLGVKTLLTVASARGQQPANPQAFADFVGRVAARCGARRGLRDLERGRRGPVLERRPAARRLRRTCSSAATPRSRPPTRPRPSSSRPPSATTRLRRGRLQGRRQGRLRRDGRAHRHGLPRLAARPVLPRGATGASGASRSSPSARSARRCWPTATTSRSG